MRTHCNTVATALRGGRLRSDMLLWQNLKPRTLLLVIEQAGLRLGGPAATPTGQAVRPSANVSPPVAAPAPAAAD